MQITGSHPQGSCNTDRLEVRILQVAIAQVGWLRTQLTDEFVGTTVVVTHHLPHPRSIHRKYKASSLNPSFASDLSNLMGPSVSLWIHGHTHESFDYVVNSTRVVCNPRGYAPMELNEAFDPVFTVDARVTNSSAELTND